MPSDISAILYTCRDSNEQCRPYHNHLYYYESTFKFECEAKAAIISSKFSLHIISVVTDVSSFPNPSYSFIEGSPFRIDEWFHAYVIETVRFEEIDDVKPILNVFSGVGY
jgi:hypothetical protein